MDHSLVWLKQEKLLLLVELFATLQSHLLVPPPHSLEQGLYLIVHPEQGLSALHVSCVGGDFSIELHSKSCTTTTVPSALVRLQVIFRVRFPALQVVEH